MGLSENIYFLILFTLPAALNIIYNVHIRQVPIIRQDKSVELAECVLFCLAVFFANMLIMKTDMLKFGEYILLSESERETFSKAENFDYLSFMIQYFLLNFITSIAVIAIWYSAGRLLFRKIKNLVNKAAGRSEELKFSDVWSELFETKDFIDIQECIVKIERGGQLVAAGSILLYPPPTAEKREIALYNIESVMEIFEEDKEKDVSDRIFPYADATYYDMETDTLIKFYDNKRYEALYKGDEPG